MAPVHSHCLHIDGVAVAEAPDHAGHASPELWEAAGLEREHARLRLRVEELDRLHRELATEMDAEDDDRTGRALEHRAHDRAAPRRRFQVVLRSVELDRPAGEVDMGRVDLTLSRLAAL